MRRREALAAIFGGAAWLVAAGACGADDPRTVAPSPPLGAVPSTDPTHWFLTDAEIQAARGGAESADRGFPAFTSGNLVQPLIDGEEMMRALHDDVAATGDGDFINFTGWRMDRRLNLVPTEGAGSSSTVGDLWTSAIHRGVVSRTLLWEAPWNPWMKREYSQNRHTWRLLREAGGHAVLDGRTPQFGCHHQKSAVIQRNGEAIAFVGGIDLSKARWDTRQHDSDSRRIREYWHAWHDCHLRIRGPAVLDIERNFRQRWNACNPTREAAPSRPPITAPLPPVHPNPGTCHVQVLRTYACKDGRYRSFAPCGEFTCLEAYRKAVRRRQTPRPEAHCPSPALEIRSRLA